MSDLLTETKDAVRRLQDFETTKLARRDELGPFHFEAALPYAERLKKLYAQMSLQHLDELPQENLPNIRDNANAVFNIFDNVLKFDPQTVENPRQANDALVESLRGTYPHQFNTLQNVISYLASRQRDFSAIEQQARAAAQGATDQAELLKRQLADAEAEAKRILEEIRKTAAEQGVSQQAKYFADEAKEHTDRAADWLMSTKKWALGLGIYAGATLIMAYIPSLAPENAFEAVQISMSKILIFAVIAYMLFLSARTFLAHRHNAVINKHRQNALLTFNALADGTTSDAQRDVVVTAAANCIYAPQETGYGRASGATPPQLIEMVPKIINAGSQPS